MEGPHDVANVRFAAVSVSIQIVDSTEKLALGQMPIHRGAALIYAQKWKVMTQ